MKAYKPKFAGVALSTREGSKPLCPQRQSKPRIDSITELKADLVTCLNDKTRNTHLDTLKTQIDSGNYQIDSHTIAYKMLDAKQVLSMLVYGKT